HQGNLDPNGVRRYVDKGIWMEGEGYDKKPDFKTVLNGFPYEYTVATYDWTSTRRLAMSDTIWYHVVPSPAPGIRVDDVVVVPNPYIKHAGWDMGETKVQFFNVPEDAKIRIYDAVGGYIATVYPERYSFGGQQGRAEWNLKNGKSEDVASGVYIYRIESKTGNRIGRFVVVR
ncbi:MAG: T9SS type A sorting domain-containing protein, partial [bacterium]